MATTRRPQRHTILRLIAKGAASAALLLLLGGSSLLGLGLSSYSGYANQLVPPDQYAINRPSAGAKILDRNGKLLYQFVDDKSGVRLPVRLDEVSPAFLAATIATEDNNFFRNPGINPKGLARASLQNFNLMDSGMLQAGGGSSITQQLVKNVYIPQGQRQERSLDRKMREIVYSIELTKRYDKAQILDWYINQISYGSIYTGVEAASQGYFGKPARDLTLGEAALLAGIPQSPAAYDPLNKPEAAIARRNQVLDLMANHASIQIGADAEYAPNADDIAAAKQETLTVKAPNFDLEAPHFVLSYVVPELEQLVGKDALLHDGLVVTTSLDIDLQHEAEGIVDSTIGKYEKATNSRNGAAIVIAPATGEILAMVGSRNYDDTSIDGQVNALLGLRSPGSSFKPFIYLTAFTKLGWTPGTLIQDSPIVYHEVNGSTFQPQNPTKNTYVGPISVRRALGNSLNVPAFKAAMQVGPSDVVTMAKNMGFTGLQNYYGPSIAIGGVSIRGLDLAYGYTALANDGILAGQTSFAPSRADESALKPVAILKVSDIDGKVRYDVEEHRAQKRVAPGEQTYMITDILSDPASVCTTFGCGGLNVPGYRVAVKTGTSEPFDPNGPNGTKYGDTWAFGYTPDYVVGAWSGNSDYSPVTNIFSTTVAFPVMRDIMLKAYNGGQEKPFVKPGNLVYKQSCAAVSNFPKDVKAPGAVALAPYPTQLNCSQDLGVR